MLTDKEGPGGDATLKSQSLRPIFSTEAPCEGPPGDTPTPGLRVRVAAKREKDTDDLGVPII